MNNGKRIYFRADGMTEVYHGRAAVEHLQKAWIELFAEFLESHGEYAHEYSVHFPDGKKGRIFHPDFEAWEWTYD